MGKRRINSALLTKSYSASSGPARKTQDSVGSSTLSVVYKLSQLRLESLKHERNNASRHSHGSSSVIGVPTVLPGDAEIAESFGSHYVAPLPRAKARSRGHLAPKSWDVNRTSTRRRSFHADDAPDTIQTGVTGLLDLCLQSISSHIREHVGCGMQFLPPYIKSILLSSLRSDDSNDTVWLELVPEEDNADDAITWLDITSSRVSAQNLKRLGGIRFGRLSVDQVNSGLVFACPTVIALLMITIDRTSLTGIQITKLVRQRLATHFVALRHIYMDVHCLREDHDLPAFQSILDTLETAPNWNDGFDTLTDVVLLLPAIENEISVQMQCSFDLVKAKVAKHRRRGKYVEFHILQFRQDHDCKAWINEHLQLKN